MFFVDIVGEFLTLNISKKLRISVISSNQWNISLVTLSYLKKSDSDSWSTWFLGVTKKYELSVSFKNLLVKQNGKIPLYLFSKEKAQRVYPRRKWTLLFRSLLKIYARKNRKVGWLLVIVDLLLIKNDSDNYHDSYHFEKQSFTIPWLFHWGYRL